MRLIVAFFAVACFARDLEIARPVRAWEYVDATGSRAGLFGREDGTLEAYVFPLKLVRDLRLRFGIEDRVIPAETLARRLASRPGSCTITYTGDNFRVDETLFVPRDEAGAVIVVAAETRAPLRIDVEFTRDFQLMWPAAIGSAYEEWNAPGKAFFFGADGQPYAAVLGSPDAALGSREYATNYGVENRATFTLGTIKGRGERVLALAGSMKSRDEALATYRRLVANPRQLREDTERQYRDALSRTVELRLPDPLLQDAYDWSRVSMAKAFVDNPFLGRGLVAGYGPSKGAYRPGFAWFFGRDSFWSSLALTAEGEYAGARAAIAFISHFQRADGKIPHEISQSASLIPWFEQYPYGYASADATPLYAIAVRDYVAASGDVAFAREQAPHLWEALDFMRSTLDEAGFPKNLGVGHGWVEGGPLLPVRVEFYQAACYVEALRSLAALARVLQDDGRAQTLDREFERQRRKLDELFWRSESHAYAFALGTDGKPVDQPSVLATVPMGFGLLEPGRAREMIARLAGEEHATDWGMRIISSRSPLYDPSGYHFGSVWPLFTGWASVGEYRSHAAEPALANLRANAWLALDGAGGNTTEVLSGDTYSPLSTASPHQTWSAAMVVSPVLRGLLGLGWDAVRKTIEFAPHLPANWQDVAVLHVPVAGASVDFELHRDLDTLELKVANSGGAALDLAFAPAYPPCARVTAATLDGKPVTWNRQSEGSDWHPRFLISVPPGRTLLKVAHRGLFGYAVPFSPPQLAEPSRSLKVISERWSDGGQTLELTVSGRPSREYSLELVNPGRIANVEGARVEKGALLIGMPAGTADEYTERRITVSLR